MWFWHDEESPLLSKVIAQHVWFPPKGSGQLSNLRIDSGLVAESLTTPVVFFFPPLSFPHDQMFLFFPFCPLTTTTTSSSNLLFSLCWNRPPPASAASYQSPVFPLQARLFGLSEQQRTGYKEIKRHCAVGAWLLAFVQFKERFLKILTTHYTVVALILDSGNTWCLKWHLTPLCFCCIFALFYLWSIFCKLAHHPLAYLLLNAILASC